MGTDPAESKIAVADTGELVAVPARAGIPKETVADGEFDTPLDEILFDTASIICATDDRFKILGPFAGRESKTRLNHQDPTISGPGLNPVDTNPETRNWPRAPQSVLESESLCFGVTLRSDDAQLRGIRPDLGRRGTLVSVGGRGRRHE